MSRLVSFCCDYCKKTFGENTHLNLKNINLQISKYVAPLSWHSVKVISNNNNNELHFCNLNCYHNWIDLMFEKAKGCGSLDLVSNSDVKTVSKELNVEEKTKNKFDELSI